MSEPESVEILDLISFIRVVETGSIAGAASRLGIAKSIVSRRVSRLENFLGATLLTRSQKGTTLTDVGREYHVRAASGLAELESAQEMVVRSTTEASGQVRVSVPVAFGEFCLAPLLAEFALLHPRIHFDVRFEDRQPDLVAEAYDLAVRIGSIPDSVLITRKLAKVRWAVVASPSYLKARGRPSKPAELATHNAILYSFDTLGWRFHGPDGWEQVRVNSQFRTDNGQMMLAAARGGLGIVVLPVFMVQESLTSGDLEEVVPGYSHAGADLHILMPPARAGIARVRALVNFLYEKFEREI
ncbi:DNA-binding transcriptional LysR family regulator [Agrobacterium pusense]|uniref:LysR family transcriptional regulator n=1 Tax=Agrobacterium pusense TaxID=648995 RepID=UPI0028652AB4|nr:LysR family transcriptional regulator [Agrobacterium pusense]MDR6192589.1 DNA-binding transcriptional LysR family regulator [Agrobacterium pusense]